MRAPDKWDSARFSSLYLASSFFWLMSRVHTHPLAGNANRWVAGYIETKKEVLIGYIS
jgi:hypothetical protein